MSKPVFILTPGAWHPSEIFEKVIPHLEANGHKTVRHDWPSITQAPVKSFDEDIQSIREAVIKEAEAGHDVIVVAHSWSGSPVNSSVANLSKAERAKEGKEGGVVMLVFLCAFIVPGGVSLLDAMGGDETKVAAWNIQDDLIYVNDPAHYFYLELPEEEQRHWVSKLKPHSKATTIDPSRGAAYMTIPSVYLICEDDIAMPVCVQENMVRQAQDAGAPMTSERIRCGHSPFLSHPEETANFMMRAASQSRP